MKIVILWLVERRKCIYTDTLWSDIRNQIDMPLVIEIIDMENQKFYSTKWRLNVRVRHQSPRGKNNFCKNFSYLQIDEWDPC